MSTTAVRLRATPRHVRLVSTKRSSSKPVRRPSGFISRASAPHPDPSHRTKPRKPPAPASNDSNTHVQPTAASAEKYLTVAKALQEADAQHANPLDAPVSIPEDRHGILKEDHPAMSILANSTVIIQRQLEMMNLLIGFEQANKYVIMDPHGNHIGFLAEEDHSLGRSMMRQMTGEHRSFTTHVFDKHQKEVLRFHRPFSFISSRIRVYDPLTEESAEGNYTAASGNTSAGPQTQISSLPLDQMRIIGEAQQQWAPLRRKYNLFLHRPMQADERTPRLASGENFSSNTTAVISANADNTQERGMTQFSHVDERFLSWDFSLLSSDNQLLGSVNRSFSGFAREIFTETGSYALRMDSAGLAEQDKQRSLVSNSTEGKSITAGMTLDQRAVALATAVSVDFDFFSRRYAGGFVPIPLWIGGSGGEAVGTAEGISGGVAGAGTMAGYEAMQRGHQSQATDDASPTASDPYQQQSPGIDGGGTQGEDIWGAFSESEDPWSKGSGDSGSGGFGEGGGGGTGGGGGGGDGGSWLDSFF